MAKGKWLEERAYNYILDKIETREWLPQEHIRELKVAEDLDISRTPVRNAFKKLEDDGVLKIEPYKGAKILRPQINVQEFQNRTEYLELFIVHYLHKLEKNEVDFDTGDLELKHQELENSLANKDDDFERLEIDFWKLLFADAKNQFSKSNILETIRTLLPEEGKIYKQMLMSREGKVEHFRNLIDYLKENNYPYARREVRIFLNQLNMNVIQGV